MTAPVENPYRPADLLTRLKRMVDKYWCQPDDGSGEYTYHTLDDHVLSPDDWAVWTHVEITGPGGVKRRLRITITDEEERPDA